MISSRTRYLISLVAGLLFMAGVSDAGAQTAAATVRPDPAAVDVAAGTIQTIAVVLEDAVDVYGIDVRARFDPALVEIVDADTSKAGVQVAPGAFPQPDFVALNEVDNASGTLRYVITQVNPTPPASGSGTLFSIQVRGKAGGDSTIRIELVEMSNRSGELLPVQTADGAIRVTGAAPPAATGIVLATPAGGEQPPAPTAPPAATPVTGGDQPAPTVSAATTTSAGTGATPIATSNGAAATQLPQAGGDAPQPGSGDPATAAANAPAQNEASGEPVAAETAGEPTRTIQDPMAITQAEPVNGATDDESAAATTAALAVVGAASPADADTTLSDEPAAVDSSALMLAAAAAFTILIIAAVVLFMRRRAG